MLGGLDVTGDVAEALGPLAGRQLRTIVPAPEMGQ